MQIQNNNNIPFNGIKLSSAKFEDVREVAFDLKRAGFLNLGFKKVYCNNNFNEKLKQAQYIRERSGFLIGNLVQYFSLGVAKPTSWQIQITNS